MAEKITNLAKNTSYFTFALVLQKIISFTYFTLIARALGPEDLGKYYFAISFTTIFGIFIDLGLANVLTREVAKTKEQAEKLLGGVLAIKLPLALITCLVLILVVNLLNYSLVIKDLIYLSTICVILDSFTATFFAVIRGYHTLSFESIASVAFQVVVLITGLLILRLNLGLVWLMIALVSASTFNILYSSLLIWKKWKLKILPYFNKKLISGLIKISVPFGLYAIFQRLYTYLDSVLLLTFAGDKYVGLYQVAFKIIFALQFLPLAFTASLYPAMSAYWANNRDQLVITFERAMNYLIIISLPIAIGIASIADKVVLLFKSGYGQAVLPLQINMAALLFLFLAFPVGALLNACDKQTVNTINMAVTLAASVILNLILIPKFQAVGASLTVALTNMLMLALGLYWVPKIIKVRPMKILNVFFKSVLATLIMAIIIYFLKNQIHFLIVVLIAGFIYFFMLYLLRGFTKNDITSIFKSFKNKTPDNADI